MIALIEEACAAGARLVSACEILTLSPRTVQRWKLPGELRSDFRGTLLRF